MSRDNEQLKLLSIFHYIVGGAGSLFALMPLIHMGIGYMFLFESDHFQHGSGEPPPEFIGWIFFLMGAVFFLIGQSMALATIISGRFIAKRKNYLYSFVIGCIECVFFPFGTVLGVFTIIVLSRESVKELYDIGKK
jgi:hypothetical protein